MPNGLGIIETFKRIPWNFYVTLPNNDSQSIREDLGPLLLTWFNFNPSMDK